MSRVALPSAAPRFAEVRASHTNRAFTQKVNQALALLERWNTPVARHTLKAVADGTVKLDELGDLTSRDFAKLRKQFTAWGTNLEAKDFRTLHDEKSRAARTVSRLIDGFEWDDRIYLAASLSPRQMAVTLAHEVSHVLNRSEEHYRNPRAMLREEYRAFLASRLATGEEMTPRKRRSLKEQIISDYELEGVVADDVADLPPGVGIR